MLIDGRFVRAGHTLEADVCVVGGGAAGVAIALELINQRCRVVLLEGGGLQATTAARSLNEGHATGTSYYALDACRVRALGGGTNVWGGWCHPLEACDFEPRDWIPESGWPFPRFRLEAEYARASNLFGLPSSTLCDGSLRPPFRTPDDSVLRKIMFQIAPTRFGTAHLEVLRAAKNVRLVLHANALELGIDANGTSATGVRVGTLAGTTFFVPARFVVLAAGGLENPRLLLASDRFEGGAVWNVHGLVGRYFTDHLHVTIGSVGAGDIPTPQVFQVHRNGGTVVRGGLSLTESERRRCRLLGGAITFHNLDDPHDVLSPALKAGGYRSLALIIRALRHGRWPDSLAHHLVQIATNLDDALMLSYRKLRKPAPTRLGIGLRAEQGSRSVNRVVLDNTTDRFGMRRIRLEWRIHHEDIISIQRTQRLLACAFAPANVQMLPRDGSGGWCDRIKPGAHHMGTTRMHHDPRRGVVDENCRVHGTRNVYVAGSSVFPTCGWAPPTLTIVALALRLADILKERVALPTN